MARLLACGVDDVFVPAGDADPPAGQFDSALSLLTRLTEMGRPFARVGITGYPESHPRIDDDITVQAMWDKRHHSSYIVSNLCFDPAVLRKWVTRIRARGVTLPLYVGLAGPVDRARLLRMAARAGVAESTRFLAGHTDWFLRLGLPGGYSPERLLDRTGAALTAPGAAVAGLHLFTFNQVRQTEEWRAALLRRLARPGPRAAGHLTGTGRGPFLVTHRRPRCVSSCLQNAAHTGLRRHRLSCATVSIDCNGSHEMSGCGWEQTVNSHDNGNEVAGTHMAIAPARLVEWPLRCGPVPPLADCHSPRPETGLGRIGKLDPGDTLILVPAPGAGPSGTAPASGEPATRLPPASAAPAARHLPPPAALLTWPPPAALLTWPPPAARARRSWPRRWRTSSGTAARWTCWSG